MLNHYRSTEEEDLAHCLQQEWTGFIGVVERDSTLKPNFLTFYHRWLCRSGGAYCLVQGLTGHLCICFCDRDVSQETLANEVFRCLNLSIRPGRGTERDSAGNCNGFRRLIRTLPKFAFLWRPRCMESCGSGFPGGTKFPLACRVFFRTVGFRS
jgi:hypothetical protein